jgi:hypothetical protein
MRRRVPESVRALAVTAVLLAAPAAWAQVPSPREDAEFSRLQERLRTGDGVLVSIDDGTTVKGRVVDVSSLRMTVRVDDANREIPGDRITRVQRRRNGILLGAIIGTGAGAAVGLAARSYAYNEGGNETAALLLPLAAGLGAGIAVDALLVRPRTVYERSPSRRAQLAAIVGPGRAAARMVVSF